VEPPAADEEAEAAIPPAVAASSLLSAGIDEPHLRQPATETAREQENEADEDEEFSIDAVARHLVDNDVNIAISVSLIGDKGSAATVALARTVAETGRRTILVDMTGSALPTRLMAERTNLPGITDLLTGEAAYAETIHADRESDAHILPQGNADARRAMRGADRLSMIVDALANAYDLVLVECGPADVAGVSRLAGRGEAEIILSAADAPMQAIEDAAGGFIEAGYEDVVLLFGRVDTPPPRSGRKAA
jgi:Mrp family chromosome partitioning ATPase